jgi:hypothetical protein
MSIVIPDAQSRRCERESGIPAGSHPDFESLESFRF